MAEVRRSALVVCCFVVTAIADPAVSPVRGQSIAPLGMRHDGAVLSGAPSSSERLVAGFEEPSIVGCGKAEAARRWFRADSVEGAAGGVAEAMGETNVLHNDLTIEITDLNTAANSCTITGQNRMTIVSTSPSLTAFTFRLRSQFTITSALIDDAIPVSVSTLSTTTRRVTLDRAYARNEVFRLTIAYTGTTVSAAFGSIEVHDHAGTPAVFSLSEPYYAYTWWPVKDGDQGEPGDNSDKATLDITVTVPDSFSVAANGWLQSTQALSGNRNQYHWSSDYPISTYLVSFAASNYNKWTKYYPYPDGAMPVEFFIYPENDTPSNRSQWERVIDMMTVFRPLFGEYPFIDEKYGLYNFSFGGGMEHQTMTGQIGFSESLTSHELSHQWWGDAISCKTWSDIWLNEGFATYAECLWEEFKTGASNPTAYFAAIQARKPGNGSSSVYVPPAETSDPYRIFSSNLSYRKGAWVLHMLRHLVGDATFFQILLNYRRVFEGSSATTDDFTKLASNTYGEDLTWFIDQWIYQVGEPTYRFSWNTANIDGQEYLHVKVEQTQAPPNLDVYTMPVDVVATIKGSQHTFRIWNNARTQYFVVPVEAVPNTVQFDPDQWVLRSSLTNAMFLVGDMNGDSMVDLADYNVFTECFNGAGRQLVPGCENADFDGDQDVDCSDWVGFESAWTAGGVPPDFWFCQEALPVPAVSEWGIAALALLTTAAGTIICRRRRIGSV